LQKFSPVCKIKKGIAELKTHQVESHLISHLLHISEVLADWRIKEVICNWTDFDFLYVDTPSDININIKPFFEKPNISPPYHLARKLKMVEWIPIVSNNSHTDIKSIVVLMCITLRFSYLRYLKIRYWIKYCMIRSGTLTLATMSLNMYRYNRSHLIITVTPVSCVIEIIERRSNYHWSWPAGSRRKTMILMILR